MTKNYSFNYIITIHNKESLIADVVSGVLNCSSNLSNIYLVLDGCTDSTEEIIDELILLYSNRNIYKIYTNDVHELKAINAALRVSRQDAKGFNIVLQDDVIINELELESKIINLYEWAGNKLGIVSLRHGANLCRYLLNKHFFVLPLEDFVENIKGHYTSSSNPLYNGEFIYMEIAIKSPICIPFCLIHEVGLPDEDFAPWDDINYCYEALLKGYKNGVYSLNYNSDIEWGSMRSKVQKISHDDIIQKNIRLFKTKNKSFIKKNTTIYNSTIYSSVNQSTFSSIRFVNKSVKMRTLKLGARLKMFIKFYLLKLNRK